ncbi:UDP-N-acetylmuramoyl-L-alanyl-D-glutamate--2,6-diaminopimelate ligase [Agaricicola taiwanensis]|uniref:UDP-N-acetylmuramoyl-L-alanyl-D-glutamate--2,6-diaminopimelate ligase n=1 Tax=Agaricicola taiwanensis TaxID=591372 RepID=A0A8J2W473_9RHOB|nr:UDP-N-acetylmuramoyl-L-alanyl-D-glutamate--2,6-diaminopimelate ligase [Agaricicola taiwanensis]GGE42294.1 UDP-N-acetylmuramoyl-L-alanyl-D-glutamate--2,6-diaminopimelate ligase [Agaricicola taiwanensis]
MKAGSFALADILPSDAKLVSGSGQSSVRGVTADSRQVEPGYIFVAVPGTRLDGARFVPQALAAGAVAVVAEKVPDGVPRDVAAIEVPDVRVALSHIAARLFPKQPNALVAVTGTSGKSSVVSFTRQIWEQLGLAAASLGTLGVTAPGASTYGSLTTPDPVTLHRTLDRLASEGVTHAAFEASSHGLDQHRLDGLRLTAAAFTNLSRDHLDYHPDLESYFAAKLRLFTELLPSGAVAVVDADSAEGRRVAEVAEARGLRVLSVGFQGDDLKITTLERSGFSQRLVIEAGGRSREIDFPLVGAFQVSNALVAAALAIGAGADLEQVLGTIPGLTGVSGRLDNAGVYAGAPIFIDYAHKPDALAHALGALRPYADRHLVVVFGAGGDRDHGKRPEMGRIAAEMADRVIVTDDNPRTEDPAAIRAAILAAAPGAREIGDRGEAIATAISELKEGDVLLIAGKGHETGQIVGDRTLPFSDHEAVEMVLEKAR